MLTVLIGFLFCALRFFFFALSSNIGGFCLSISDIVVSVLAQTESTLVLLSKIKFNLLN
jgi:hypothetical protein